MANYQNDSHLVKPEPIKPAGSEVDPEAEALQAVRHQNGRPEVDYYQDQPESEHLADSGYYQESAAGSQVKGPAGSSKNSLKKKLLIGSSGLAVPLVIIVLLAHSFGMTGTLEHVSRTVIGLRFSRIHLAIGKRQAHIRGQLTIMDGLYDNDVNRLKTVSNINVNSGSFRSSSLVARLFSLDQVSVFKDLTAAGFELEFENKTLGNLGIRKNRLKTIKKGGQVIDVDRKTNSSLEILQTIEREVGPKTGDSLRNRIMARRQVAFLAQQVGLKFARTRQLINKISQNQIRPPPGQSATLSADQVTTEVNQDMIAAKTDLRNRINPRLVFNASGIKTTPEEIELYGQNWANQADNRPGSVDLDSIRPKMKTGGFISRIAGGISSFSLSVTAATMFCTMYELSEVVRDMAQLKVNGQMEAAARLITLRSQARAGEMVAAVADDNSRRFEGFSQAPTYLLATGALDQATLDQAVSTGSIETGADGFNLSSYGIGSIFGVLARGIVSFVDGLLEITGLFVDSTFNWLFGDILKFFGVNIKAPLSGSIGGICQNFLSITGQLLATAVELFLGIKSFGITAAASLGIRGSLKAIWPALSRGVLVGGAIGVGGAIAFDEFVDRFVLPESADILSGVSTTISPEPGSGVENYTLVDYGSEYLSLSQSLAEGGQPVSVSRAAGLTLAGLDQNRLAQKDRGLWANLFALDNPYSFRSGLMARLPDYSNSRVGQTKTRQLADLGNWLLSFPGRLTAGVQANNQDKIARLLYPHQTETIGFDHLGSYDSYDADLTYWQTADVSSLPKFSFIANSLYVESNLNDFRTEADQVELDFRDKYGHCLTLTAADFLLDQVGITRLPANQHSSEFTIKNFLNPKTDVDTAGQSLQYYPDICQTEDAQRYMLYYQDCSHIDEFDFHSQNKSTLSSQSTCDQLRPAAIASADLDLTDSGGRPDLTDTGEPRSGNQGTTGPDDDLIPANLI